VKMFTMRQPACLALLPALIFACAIGGLSQNSNRGYVAPNAPPDKPMQTSSQDEVARLEAAIKPYLEKAKQTYPAARQRFLAGLPPKHGFFLTTRLHDKEGHFEQTFIAVTEIKDGIVKGRIANELTTVTGYKQGDEYTFPESDILDWTITLPDGTEEGNFIGKFLDEYQKQP
jgi:uncharacterized protein YegJ (DUF2314 family)